MDHTISIRRLYDLINADDIDGFGRQLADDFVERDEMPGLPPTKDGVVQYFRLLLAAFPDMRMDVQDSFASGEKAVARLRVSGTHKGEFMGIPATGNSVAVNLIDITRFGDDGVAREHWGVADLLALMQQLGVIPAGPPA
ncbi:MAG: ester cyclase [Chloroflexi bacterium]|nr:ester cyclase [Chloroflexota bacterium]MCI0576885.1 ester cyclase [Chloroflexota bacterium]MCI0646461.1 ester cyclase [Chloroflexota bacterium]MCI0729918.1 ester cyclase [Chloroflexota bacterium]